MKKAARRTPLGDRAETLSRMTAPTAANTHWRTAKWNGSPMPMRAAAAARIGIGDPFHFAVRQCVFAAVGAVILLSVSALSPRGVRRAAFFIYVAAIAVMMVLPIMGNNAKGATLSLIHI